MSFWFLTKAKPILFAVIITSILLFVIGLLIVCFLFDFPGDSFSFPSHANRNKLNKNVWHCSSVMVRVNRISIWDFYISVLNFHSLHLWQTPPLLPPSRALYSVWSILLLLLLLWTEGEKKNYELLGLWSFDNRNLQVSKSVKIRMRSGDSYRFISYPPILPPSSFHVSLCTCLKHLSLILYII